MAVGQINNMVNLGTFNVSGAALQAAVSGANIGAKSTSGGQLIFLDAGNGQVQVLRTNFVEGW